jgi:hypothetical protein
MLIQNNTDEIIDIVKKFHNKVFAVLKICKKLDPKSIELQHLHNIASLARDTEYLLIISRCKDKMWLHREHIINRDENFFLKNKFTQYIKDDENKSFMHSLVNVIQTGYRDISDTEKDMIWRLVQDMLKHVIEYKKAIGDFAN